MRSTLRFSLFVLVLLPLLAIAAEPARLTQTERAIEWQSAGAPAFLSVQRPDGEVITEAFTAGHNPMLRLEGLADGAYSFELNFAQGERESGAFTIENGVLVSPRTIETQSSPRFGGPVSNTYFADDVAAAGGLCGGSDCTSSETYPNTTIKMKANNTRLKFEDTSTSAGFPTTDWQVTANDATSGGANKLAFEDLTAATVPFTIEGGAPTNTLWVDNTGRVGIGTSTPGRELNISTSVVQGIRMSQSVSPFQTWDVTASANSFTVRDVNHESDPFIVRTSAPYYSLVVDSTGRIGLGVSSPLYQIHHSSGARLDAGNWINASSREVKQDIHELDAHTALATVEALQPVTFAYKANPAETNVGFIAEDVPELVATRDRKGLSAMDIVAVLTKVVQEQEHTIAELQARLDKLEKK